MGKQQTGQPEVKPGNQVHKPGGIVGSLMDKIRYRGQGHTTNNKNTNWT